MNRRTEDFKRGDEIDDSLHIQGTCEYMCPLEELEERQLGGDIWVPRNIESFVASIYTVLIFQASNYVYV